MTIELILGDCLDVMRTMPDKSVDAVITDPPYGISFMGNKWDYDVPSIGVWVEVLRVLKPGGHLLSFGGTRTYHRMVVNIEDAGFEIRDQIQWLYGSGFPKSHNIGKAIDKMAGAERNIIGNKKNIGHVECGDKTIENQIVRHKASIFSGKTDCEYITAPATPEAEQWEGWGTALKPANEPICLARKPFNGTVADNVIKWGTGAINIDGCRIRTTDKLGGGAEKQSVSTFEAFDRPWKHNKQKQDDVAKRVIEKVKHAENLGRWPANIIFDEVAGKMLDVQSGEKIHSAGYAREHYTTQGNGVVTNFENNRKSESPNNGGRFGDSGGASRFFYCAKASKSERNAGLERMEEIKHKRTMPGGADTRDRPIPCNQNFHPTVKPISLMRYLCRLITPSNGLILDPFMGSGTTGCATQLEEFSFIGIEIDPTYFAIAQKRIHDAQQQPGLFHENA